MAKRAALGTVLTAIGLFLAVFFVLWVVMAILERVVTGDQTWPGQKPKILHRTATIVEKGGPTAPEDASKKSK